MNKYDLTGEFGIGYTSNGGEFYFDLEDYEKIKDYTWGENAQGYIERRVTKNGKSTVIRMQNVIMNFESTTNTLIDHIHRNRKDYRKSELRIVTKSQNAMNSKLRVDNTSGIKGVGWAKNVELWEAYITVDRRKRCIGLYKNKSDAIAARLKAEKEFYGEFAPQQHLFQEYGVL